MENLTDHDLLIRIDERTIAFERQMENHLRDHKKYMVMAWSTCIGLVITLVVLLLKIV